MRLIDADEIIKETYGVVIEDMFHMHETVEVVSTIDIEKAPTVEAIPIEWLINYEIKNGQETRLQEAITQWEKENETN